MISCLPAALVIEASGEHIVDKHVIKSVTQRPHCLSATETQQWGQTLPVSILSLACTAGHDKKPM
jgi:hypothetical protein